MTNSEPQMSIEAIEEVIGYLLGYIEKNEIIINIPENENHFWEINHYLKVDLPYAIEQAKSRLKECEILRNHYDDIVKQNQQLQNRVIDLNKDLEKIINEV